jgi:hypothetical protein
MRPTDHGPARSGANPHNYSHVTTLVDPPRDGPLTRLGTEVPWPRRWHRGGMSIRVLRAVALQLAALTMGLLFAHVLELGPKFGYPPALYIELNNSLYVWYGPPLGALLYVSSIVAAAVLTWLVRRRRAVLAWTGAAATL